MVIILNPYRYKMSLDMRKKPSKLPKGYDPIEWELTRAVASILCQNKCYPKKSLPKSGIRKLKLEMRKIFRRHLGARYGWVKEE